MIYTVNPDARGGFQVLDESHSQVVHTDTLVEAQAAASTGVFDLTKQEAQHIMAKLDTARAIVAAVKTLAPITDTAEALEAEYFDAGTFTDVDVVALGITATDLAACLTLVQQVNLLMTGEATTPAIYRASVNKVRRVAA